MEKVFVVTMQRIDDGFIKEFEIKSTSKKAAEKKLYSRLKKNIEEFGSAIWLPIYPVSRKRAF